MGTTYYLMDIYEGFQNKEALLPVVMTSGGHSPLFNILDSSEILEKLEVELPMDGDITSFPLWKETIKFILQQKKGEVVLVHEYPRILDDIEELFAKLEGSFGLPDPIPPLYQEETVRDPQSGCLFRNIS